jgi:hypothetical protein
MYEISPFFVLTLSQHLFFLRLLPTTRVADQNSTARYRCRSSPHAHTPYPQPETRLNVVSHRVVSCRAVPCRAVPCHAASSRVASCRVQQHVLFTRRIQCDFEFCIWLACVFLRTPCWCTTVQKVWSWRTDTIQTDFSGSLVFVILSGYFCTTFPRYPKAIWAT